MGVWKGDHVTGGCEGPGGRLERKGKGSLQGREGRRGGRARVSEDGWHVKAREWGGGEVGESPGHRLQDWG